MRIGDRVMIIDARGHVPLLEPGDEGEVTGLSETGRLVWVDFFRVNMEIRLARERLYVTRREPGLGAGRDSTPGEP